MQSKTTYKLNFRFLAVLVIGLGLTAVSLRAVYAYQTKNNAAALLRLAEQAHDQVDLERQLKYLNLYLVQVPDDVEALVEYGTTLGQIAKDSKSKQRAFAILERAIGLDSSRDAVRRAIADLALQDDLGLYKAAEEHLLVLQKSNPDDAEVCFRLGLCHEALGQFIIAESNYRKAISLSKHFQSYVRLAEMLAVRLQKFDAASTVVNDLIQSHASDLRSWLVSARLSLFKASRTTNLAQVEALHEEASQALEEARTLDSKNPDVLLASADFEQSGGHFDRARRFLASGIESDPKNNRFYEQLARMELALGQVDQAKEVLQKGLAIVVKKASLTWMLANIFATEGSMAQVGPLLAELRVQSFPLPLIDFVNARILLAKGQWLEAKEQLVRILPDLFKRSELQYQANLLLAECFEQLGDTQEQANALRRALELDPLSEPANLGLGMIYSSLGKNDEALDAYRRVIHRSAQARYLTGLLLIRQTLTLPTTQRSWSSVEHFLDEVKQSAKPAEWIVLRAEYLAGKDQLQQAQSELTAALKKQSDDPSLWVAQAMVVERQKQWQQALQILDDAEAQLGAHAEIALARIRIWTEYGAKEASKELTRLGLNLGSYSLKERRLIQYALAEAQIQIGDLNASEDLYQQMAAADPTNLGVRMRLLDLARQKGDEAAMSRWIAALKTIEGPDGTIWRIGQLQLWLTQAQQGHRETIDDAREILQILKNRRGNWPTFTLLQGEIYELDRQPEAALRCYQEALQAGVRSPNIIRHVAELLYQRHRYLEAGEVLQLMQGSTASLSLDNRIAAEAAMRKQEPAKAFMLAQRAVSKDSNDPHDLLWLGQVLCNTGHWEEADPILRRAAALGENLPETWLTLVQYLVRTGHKDQSESVLTHMKAKLPADQMQLTLAQCYEYLGDDTQARQCYQAALQARPKDLVVLRNLARFSLRFGDVDAAERHLRAIVSLQSKGSEDAAWARHLLAVVLAASSDYQKSQTALALLGVSDSENLKKGGNANSAEELRARAIVLARQRSPERRRQAITILESLSGSQKQAEDQFLLAQLYDSFGDWSHVRDVMVNLLTGAGDNPRYLAFFVDRLLQHKDSARVAQYQQQLEKVQPDSFRTLRLKALTLASEKHADQALPFLLDLVRKKPALSPQTAEVLEEIGQFAAAEAILRENMTQVKNGPLTLAAFLGRREKTAEALQLCDKSWTDCSPEAVAETLLSVLNSAKSPPADCQLALDQIDRAMIQEKNKAVLLSASATILRMRGQVPAAIDRYRAVLNTSPNDPLTLNNLAWLLALYEGKTDEALTFIDKAIAVQGPEPSLLDTRAVIRIVQGKSQPALEDLENVIQMSPTRSAYFHRTRAYLLAGNRIAATRDWIKAKELGLTEEDLDAREREAMAQIWRLLG